MRIAVVTLVLAAAPGCVRHLHPAPPLAPAKVIPEVELVGEPAPGMTRVILDVQEGPAIVQGLYNGGMLGPTASFGGGGPRICITPCVYETTPGHHELHFTLLSDARRVGFGIVNADTKLTAYRFAVGAKYDRRGRGLAGGPLALIGIIVEGSVLNAMINDSERHQTFIIAGGAIGSVLTALGVYLLSTSVVVDQPGAGVQWHPTR